MPAADHTPLGVSRRDAHVAASPGGPVGPSTRVYRIGLSAAAAGGALWIVSEAVEIAGGGISSPSMALLIAGCLLLAAGVPALHRAQAHRAGALSLAGAAMLSVATALEALTDTIGWGADNVEDIQAETGPLIPVFGVLLVLGGIALGTAILRAGVLPRWTGILLIAAPPLLPVVNAAGLPEELTSVAKSLIGLAILGGAMAALSAQRHRP